MVGQEMQYNLDRYESGNYGTFGLLTHPSDDRQWDTLEPPLFEEKYWNGIPYYPAIPEGTYTAVKYPSSQFGVRWLLQNTEPRTGILIHAGNVWRRPQDGHVETRGCIMLGKSIGSIWNIPGLIESRDALASFEHHNVGQKQIEIKIKNCFMVGKVK